MEELPGALCQAWPHGAYGLWGRQRSTCREKCEEGEPYRATGCREGFPGEGTGKQEQKGARAFTGQGGVGARGQINELIPLLSASWKRGADTTLLACFEDSVTSLCEYAL